MHSAFLFLILTIFSTSVFAWEETAQSFTLDGRLYDTATPTDPLLDSGTIKVQILSQDSLCILYEEQQPFDTTASNGYFNIHVGTETASGLRSSGDSANNMARVFSNTGANITGKLAADGVTVCSYNADVGHLRKIRLKVTPSDLVVRTLSPDMTLDSVPTAVVAESAESVQGLTRANMLELNTVVPLTQANVENIFSAVNYPILTGLIAGTNTNYVQTDANGAELPTFAADPGTPATGQIWYDTTLNQIRYKDNTATIKSLGTGTGNGTVTNIATGTGLTGGPITVTGTISLDTVGTAGTYTKVTTDAYGRVSSGTTLLEADIPTLSTAGKVSGSAINTGTIGGNTVISTTGSVSSASSSTRILDIYDSDNTNFVRIQTPATGLLISDYTLTLPVDTGTPGYYLTTNGSGTLSWSAPPQCLANQKLQVTAGPAISWSCVADVDTGATDHGALTGLTDDDHTQYTLTAGRAGGQNIIGGTASGDDLSLESTSDGTKGDIILQPTSGNVGIGTATPGALLDVNGLIRTASDGVGTGYGNYYLNLPINQLAGMNYLLLAKKVAGQSIVGRLYGRRNLGSTHGEWGAEVNVFIKSDSGGLFQVSWDSKSNITSIAVVQVTYAGEDWYALAASATDISKPFDLGTFQGRYSAQPGQLTWVATADVSGIVAVNSNDKYNFGNHFVVSTTGDVGIGMTSPNSKLTVEGAMTLDQLGADPAGTAGYGSLFVRDDGKLYYRDGTGTVTDMLALGSAGEANTASNVTSGGGVGIWKQKSTVDLEFKSLLPGSTKLSVSGGASDVTLDVVEANINHNNLSGYSANRHIDHSAVSIDTAAGSALTGGGDLTANRSLAVQVDDSTIEINSNALRVKDSGITSAKIVSLTADKISSGGPNSGIYFAYMPDGNECGDGQVLKWTSDNSWSCANDTDTGATDHGALTGLTDDDHGQYTMNAGRAGGQSVFGGTASGDDLTLDSTSDGTKGDIILQPTSGNVGIGTTPNYKLEVNGSIGASGEIRANGASVVSASGGNWKAALGNSSGDGEVFLKNSIGVQQVAVQANGSTYFNGGNVGIGTITPGTKLEVSGDDTSTLVRTVNTSSTAAKWPAFHAVNYANTFAATAAPAVIFNQYRGSSAVPDVLQNGDYMGAIAADSYTGAGSSWTAGINFKATETHSATDGGSSIHFYTTPNDSRTAATRIMIDENGEVGIGNTNPQSMLDVSGTITATGFVGPITSNTTTTAGTHTINSDSDSAGADGGINFQVRGTNAAQITNGGNFIVDTDTLAVDAGNNRVGIGTASPSYQLDIESAAATGGVIANVQNTSAAVDAWGGLQVENDVGTIGWVWTGSSGYSWADAQSRLMIQTSNTNGAGISLFADKPGTDIRFAVDSGEALRILDGGNVGIGTTSPDYKLDIYLDASSAGTWDVGARTYVDFAPAVNPVPSTWRAGSETRLVTGGAADLTNASLQATIAAVRHETTSDINDLYGGDFSAYNNSTGAVQNVYGISAGARNNAGGTIDWAGAVYGDTRNMSTGTITEAAGLYSTVRNSGGGTITDAYGLYISEVQGTNTWGIYQNDADNKNRFNGQVGVGVTPSYSLDVGNATDYQARFSDTGSSKGGIQIGQYGRFQSHIDIDNNYDRVLVGYGVAYDSATDNYDVTSNVEYDRAAIEFENSGRISFMSDSMDRTADPLLTRAEWKGLRKMIIDNNGNVGIGVGSPTATLHLKAGTTSAETAPLKFESGPVMIAAENGAMEYNGTEYFVTASGVRRSLATTTTGGALDSVTSITGTGALPISAGGASNNLTLSATGAGEVISTSVTHVTNTTASTGTTSGALIVDGGLGVAGAAHIGASVTVPFIYGSSASGGDLTIDSTSHATKGDLIIAPGTTGNVGVGAAASVKFEVNIPGAPILANGSTGDPGFWTNKGDAGITNTYWGILNTGSGSTSSNRLTFGSNSSVSYGGFQEKMVITNAGNVGIGTAAPPEKLTVSQGEILLENDDNWGAIYHMQHSDTKFADVSARRSRGTQALPTFVQSGDKIGQFSFFNHSHTGALAWMAGVATETHNATSGGTKLEFHTTPNTTEAGALRMTIDQDGEVGIGTSSPLSLLDVAGVSRSQQARLHHTDPLTLYFESDAALNEKYWMVNADTGVFKMSTMTDIFSGGDTFFQVDRTAWTVDNVSFPVGNVGIGTTAPAAKLDSRSEMGTESLSTSRYVGSNTWPNEMRFSRSRGTLASPATSQNGDLVAYLDFGAYDGSTTLYSSAIGSAITGAVSGGTVPMSLLFHTGSGGGNGPERMRIDHNGNVGIGTANPLVKFTVSANTDLQTPATDTLLHLTNANGLKTRLGIDTFGAGAFPTVNLRASLGTAAAPSATAALDSLGYLNATGYGTSDYGAGGGTIGFIATEAWTDSANGTRMTFQTTPNGSNAKAVRMTIDQSGYVGLGISPPREKLDLGGILLHNGGNPSVSFNSYYDTVDARPEFAGHGGGSAYSAAFNFAKATGKLNINMSPAAGAVDTANSEVARVTIQGTDGYVGIGTTSPNQLFEVNGNVRIGSQTTRTTSTGRGQLAQGSTYVVTVNASTTVDLDKGNIQELNTFLCDGSKVITLSNLRDGAAYTLLLSGTAAHTGTCLFSAGGYVFKASGGNVAPTASKDILFTFAVINTTVVYSMLDDLQ